MAVCVRVCRNKLSMKLCVGCWMGMFFTSVLWCGDCGSVVLCNFAAGTLEIVLSVSITLKTMLGEFDRT